MLNRGYNREQNTHFVLTAPSGTSRRIPAMISVSKSKKNCVGDTAITTGGVTPVVMLSGIVTWQSSVFDRWWCVSERCVKEQMHQQRSEERNPQCKAHTTTPSEASVPLDPCFEVSAATSNHGIRNDVYV